MSDPTPREMIDNATSECDEDLNKPEVPEDDTPAALDGTDEFVGIINGAAVARAKEKLGLIEISFPENFDAVFEDRADFPLSYRTLSPKERLLLLFAENFRLQFSAKFLHRRPPILAVKNECGVQKFVSTTIRTSYFLFPELIGSWEQCASFVADFVHYEPLPDQTAMPRRLISPDSLLRRRQGNSFEMATLLCSVLIGQGFRDVYVVSGYASREVVNNDQTRTVCPIVPGPFEVEEAKQTKPPNKYTLKDAPDLRSKFLIDVELREKAKLDGAKRMIDEEKAQIRKDAEKLEPDPLYCRRVHAWVLVLLKTAKINELDEAEPKPVPLFIEPSTGFSFPADDPKYLGIESVWNQFNYYINRQEPITNVANTKFDMGHVVDWEHLLPAEPAKLRVDCPIPDDMDSLTVEEEVSKEKHLDMPTSWVQQLHIGNADFEERFPNGIKTIHYMRAIHERFAPYRKRSGMTSRLTTYDTLEYTDEIQRWEWYENRQDRLQVVAVDFRTQQLEEYFVKGRPDCLRYYTHNAAPNKERIFKFYDIPRLDAMKLLEVHPLYIRVHYNTRNDRLYYRDFQIHETNTPKQVIHIEDKYRQDVSKEPDRDVALRKFDLIHNTIFVQFQYAKDAITSSSRMYRKPPKADYEKETLFNPLETKAYNCNPADIEISQLEQYLLLLELLNAEEEGKLAFDAVCKLVDTLLSTRKSQMEEPRLTFNIFDPLRNNAARNTRLAKFEALKERNELALKSDADYIAPYLVRYEHKRPNHEQSVAVYNACLVDLKEDFLESLNELQRRYDEHVSELLHFKRFLKKFQNQFDDFDYDRLIKEGHTIAVNKRMLQQRLMTTSEVSQAKYDKIKRRLLQDDRLGFDAAFVKHELEGMK